MQASTAQASTGGAMKRPQFDAMIAKICAAFVFPYPLEETLDVWFQLAGEKIEFGAPSIWVCNEFCTRNKRITRGTNIGAELAEIWKEYRKDKYLAASCGEQKGCKDCSSDMAGYIFAQQYNGNQQYRCTLVCACNTDPRMSKYPHYTRDSASRAGFSVLA